MADAMVTGRMSQQKKEAGGRVLKEAGLNASQAVNLLYDKLIEEGNAEFLTEQGSKVTWADAFEALDAISKGKKKGAK